MIKILLIFDHSFYSFSWLLAFTFQLLQLLHKLLIPITELIIPTEIPNKEGKAEILVHPITAKAKIRKSSIQFRANIYAY